EIFGAKLKFDSELVRAQLEAKTYLHKGLHVQFEDQATGEKIEYTHDGGIRDYLLKIVAERGKPPIHQTPFEVSSGGAKGAAGDAAAKGQPRLELALMWTEATDEQIRSYVNGIQTGSGGTHEAGLK